MSASGVSIFRNECRCGHGRDRHVMSPGSRSCYPKDEPCACLGYRSAASGAFDAERARVAGITDPDEQTAAAMATFGRIA